METYGARANHVAQHSSGAEQLRRGVENPGQYEMCHVEGSKHLDDNNDDQRTDG